MHTSYPVAGILAVLSISSFAAPPKPKPVVTVKDLALAEARKCDADHNGRIKGMEVFALRAAHKRPGSYLYMFDDNSDKSLDTEEIARIRFSPAPKPV